MFASPRVMDLATTSQGVVETLCGLDRIAPLSEAVSSESVVITFEGEEVLLGGLIDSGDLDKERARLTKLCEQKRKQISGFEGRLGNEAYVQKAKPELVAETRRMLEASRTELEAAEAALARLG